MSNSPIKKISLALILVLFFAGKSAAQLNSLDVYGGPHKLMNSYYADPKQPWGTTFGLRYNLDFSWEWALMLSAGMDKTTFNMATTRDISNALVPAAVTNTYADFTLGLEWQWMTEVRTRLGGGKVSMRGSKSIIMANFKSYLLGGLNYKMLMKSGNDKSSKNVMNWTGGIGFEWFRFGKNAHHGNNAFVPFTEFIYCSNLSSQPYAEDLTQKIMLKSFLIRFGVKYTFGFPEKKFAWK